MHLSDVVNAAAVTKSSWPVLIVLGLVVALVALIVAAQLTDPERQRQADERRLLVGDAWRPRNVVRHLTPELLARGDPAYAETHASSEAAGDQTDAATTNNGGGLNAGKPGHRAHPPPDPQSSAQPESDDRRPA